MGQGSSSFAANVRNKGVPNRRFGRAFGYFSHEGKVTQGPGLEAPETDSRKIPRSRAERAKTTALPPKAADFPFSTCQPLRVGA